MTEGENRSLHSIGMAEDPADQSKPEARRPLGRPRREDIDAKVLNATFEVLGELGYQRMSVGDVALRAGVGRATVYRRWPTKKQLVSAAVGSLATGYTAGDSGDLKAGMADLTKNLLHRGLDSPAGHALPQFIAEMATTVSPSFVLFIQRISNCSSGDALSIYFAASALSCFASLGSAVK